MIENWKYKWFGYWKEYGKTFDSCPSIHDFVNPEVAHGYDIVRVGSYLRECTEISSTSRINFPDPYNGELIDGAISGRTDGVWNWLDDLPDYIEKYQVAIPLSFLNHIEKNNYHPVKDWSGDSSMLDYPNLG